MPKLYRIRTQLGINQNIPVKIPIVLEQNFDTLEILSLAIRPDDFYIRSCSNYGVVCGRVFCNKGFGIPNTRVSIFIPIEDIDTQNDYIDSLYPYTNFTDINDDGYRYNLLPYTQSHTGHVPVGTFPEREDVLTDNLLVQVYEKYYKFTVKTNESGDYMIFGVPTGQQTLFMQVDLSDIGEFSLTPQDLIRMGIATEQSVDGPRFSFSTNYGELPQIVTTQKTVQIEPFFGEFEICNYNIARVDFDLTSENGVKLEPTAVFMGSLISNDDTQRVGKKVSFLGQTSACSVKRTAGEMCSLTKGPGEIIALRQTIYNDENGRPILERAVLDNDGKVIDENGVWVLEVPMNLDYIYTDENGERKISGSPEVGVPTRGKYRFKIKWQQPPEIAEPTKRAYFLAPNIKERGWTSIDADPLDLPASIAVIPDNTGSGAGEITAQLPVAQGEFYRIGRTQNVINLSITDPDGNPYISRVFRTPGIFTFTFLRDDIAAPFIFEFENIPAAKFMLEGSYAFSLDWNDYAVPEEAINCEDTFYDMSYNKVYTTTQLIDRYQGTRFAWNTLGIKKITDVTCQGDFNTFPTNDVFYRVDFLYLVISFFLQLFKIIGIVILFVLHVFSWLMTTGFPILFSIIEGLLAYLAVLFVLQAINAANSVTGFGVGLTGPVVVVNYGQIFAAIGYTLAAAVVVGLGIYLATLYDDFRDAGKKLKNFTLPLVLYTDDGCETCRCNISGEISNEIDSTISVSVQVQGDAQTSYLINSTSSPTYNGIPLNVTNNISQLLTGSLDGILTRRFPINPLTTVNTTTYEVQPLYQYYTTTALPPSELYNLFNTKSKYFNDVPGFGNGFEDGWNQIKVNWFPDINTSLQDYHFDNIMVLVLDKTIPTYNSGDLITFQDVTLSGDLNRTVTTGTTIFPSALEVKYADPDAPLGGSPVPNLTQYYNVPILSSQTSFDSTTSFAADVEYFQVITGMTIGQYVNLANPSSNMMSFGVRYLQKLGNQSLRNIQFVRVIPNIGVIDQGENSLSNYITDYNDYNLVFLFRGVDTHSPRIPQKVDLSKIFGFAYDQFFDDPTYVIQGNFKMNYPITGTIKTDRHDDVLDNISSNLFRPSYAFEYSQTDFIGNGTTNLPSYYSSVDSTSFNSDGTLNWIGTNINNFWNGYLWTGSNIVGQNIVNGLTVSDGSVLSIVSDLNCNQNSSSYNVNSMTKVFKTVETELVSYGGGPEIFSLFKQQVDNRCSTNRNVLGYQGNEVVDGASFMRSNFSYNGDTAENFIGGFYNIFTDGSGASIGDSNIDPFIGNPKFFSTQYNTGNTHSLSNRLNIVFRSDRLPTSTTTQTSGPNSFLLHQNSQFAILKVSEEGQVSNPIIVDTSPQSNNESSQIITPSIYASLLNSVSDCRAAVPLSCYAVDSNGIPYIIPNCASEYMDPPDDYKYFLQNFGCYNFVSRPLRNIDQDVRNLVEWITRVNLNLALCFNVASHNFTNQYINGTLYAYPFQNQRIFDLNNKPTSVYCTDLIYLHSPTNNFYYRSSPYSFDINNMDGGDFTGKKNSKGNATSTGNNKFLGSPITIMDLGPKVSFIQEIVYNDDYDGYIVSKIKSSSFQNITDILNLFVLSRLVNTTFNQQLIPPTSNPDEGNPNPTVSALFKNTRWNINGATPIPGYVDGDYSQMIAINSQFGIQEFSPESYTNQSVYFGPSNTLPVFGLLLTGFTQDRDYLTPRRTIWNQTATVPLPSNQQILDCWFTNIKTNSQKVPFYQWSLNSTNTIVGNQSNNYDTDDSVFFSHKYQTLDRLNPSSNYFQDGQGNSSLIPGTQINFDVNGNPTVNPPQGQFSKFLVGAPFYFYFGLIKGSSAMDVFIKKYVNTDIDV